jgi:Zn-dependent protease with chaperone function
VSRNSSQGESVTTKGSWPLSHSERIQLVYRNVLNAAVKANYLDWSPELTVLGGNVINAYAHSDMSRVDVTLGLSQLLSDSESELAHVIAHELGHMYQFRYGKKLWNLNAELDADVWGVIIAVQAGYDPYGAAGALGKLGMASGSAGLIDQIITNLTDVHTSFANRLDNLYQTLTTACNSSVEAKTACDNYKRVFHPNLPTNAPLEPEKSVP